MKCKCTYYWGKNVILKKREPWKKYRLPNPKCPEHGDASKKPT